MLQIRLLGQFDVRLNGKRVLIPSQAGQSLLAYLVLTAGAPQRRKVWVGILWPDFSEENARKNLRHELWRIRKAISTQEATPTEYFLIGEFTLTFNRETDYWLDVMQIERTEFDLQGLISNLSHYQGELLPDFYEDGVVLERERIRSVFDSRMEQLIDCAVHHRGTLAISGQHPHAFKSADAASAIIQGCRCQRNKFHRHACHTNPRD